MSQKRIAWIFIISSLVLLITIYLLSRSESNSILKGVGDPATALIFITTVAVAIERFIELIWTFIGGAFGTYWPLNLIANQAEGMVEDLDNSLKPFYKEMTASLEGLLVEGEITEKQLSSAKEEISRLSNRFDEIKNLPLNNQRLQMLIAVSSKNVDYISEKYGKIIGGGGASSSYCKISGYWHPNIFGNFQR